MIPTKISTNYVNYINIFSSNLGIVLYKNIGIYKNIINLINEKHLPYKLVYTLSLIEL